MSLDVIGAGYGRTGTASIRRSLSLLGFPCYHMFDLLFGPNKRSDIEFWLEVARAPKGTPHDWRRIFKGYRATLDFPACTVWRDLAVAFPEAKVLLTLHPSGPESWYESTRNTIYVGTGLDAGTPFGRKVNEVMDRLAWEGMLEGAMEDRARAISRYKAHVEEVRDTIPAERLLIFSADQGWKPLCAFLGVPTPKEPFAKINGREDMARTVSRLVRMGRISLDAAGK